MTDNDIIKALECCAKLNYADNWDICKKECPYAQNCYDEANGVHFLKDLIEFINRQKAEIERSEKEVDRLSQVVLYHDGQIADAVKEFAERLKATMEDFARLDFNGSTYFAVGLHHIDNLVKEFEEGKKRWLRLSDRG